MNVTANTAADPAAPTLASTLFMVESEKEKRFREREQLCCEVK